LKGLVKAEQKQSPYRFPFKEIMGEMTQVVSVSAITASYAMDAARPARRVATTDQVKDQRVVTEKEQRRVDGTDPADISGIIPAVPLAFDVTTSQQQRQHTSLKQARDAYEEI
jgi:hypothetical protein